MLTLIVGSNSIKKINAFVTMFICKSFLYNVHLLSIVLFYHYTIIMTLLNGLYFFIQFIMNIYLNI